MSEINTDIDLEQPIIDTMASRAKLQVDVAESLVALITCGLEVPDGLLTAARELGVDVDAIHAKINELYGEEPEG